MSGLAKRRRHQLQRRAARHRPLRQAAAATLGLLPVQWAIVVRQLMWRSPQRRQRWSKRGEDRGRGLNQFLVQWPIAQLGSFALPDDTSIRLVAIDAWLVRRLFWAGVDGYEPGEARSWVAACRSASRIVEIGANVGWYTVLGARAAPHASYTAVEPQPAAADVLRANLRLNKLQNVHVIQAAVVGDRATETVRLHFPDGSRDDPVPCGAFADGIEFDQRDKPRSTHSVRVSTVAAADVIRDADLVKLDIEGLEADVLLAVESLIAKHRPVIFVELLSEAVRLQELIERWCRDLRYGATPVGPRDVILAPTST